MGVRKPDFSGYATKAGLRCTDGRTILPDAFKHQDKTRVPLVWQHTHNEPTNVLGHCLLKNRPDGVYAYAFLNKSDKANHTRELVEHGDINSLSIWANQLVEKAKMVAHGMIREVSLVLAGQLGAQIDYITIRHEDGADERLDDEAIITSGAYIEHADADDDDDPDDDDDETVQDVYESLTDKQKDVVHFMIGQALESAADGAAKHAFTDDTEIQEAYESMTDEQKEVLHRLVGAAVQHSATNEGNTAGRGATTQEGNSHMSRNVFEQQGGTQTQEKHVLTHDAMKGILSDAKKVGSLKEAIEEYALQHGITDIETLFPDAKAVADVPEWVSRRMEWVNRLLQAVRKNPFSRIKTLSADITHADARAKGYVKGTLKKEEFFAVSKRVTTPTTIYKKQALDRDDIIDITDFDVVAWLKAEMRIMLDEELARAILLGDGRDVSDEDKINEQNIRPIATDHELYTTVLSVNVGDSNSSMNEVTDAITMNRSKYRGTGTPTLFTTEYWIGRWLTLRDNDGRRMYKNLQELALELRVTDIVPVEVMVDYPTMIGIIVNPVDYVLGADRGGQVAMFDDFDIDYNKQKYLIETRVSGALVKIKSAMVIMATNSGNTLAAPTAPTFDPETGALTIINTTGVVYKNSAGTTVNAAGSPYTVDPGETEVITTTPASGYYFATSDDDSWTFTADA